MRCKEQTKLNMIMEQIRRFYVMSYELKEYLNSINHRKNNLMDGDDEMWEKEVSSVHCQ